MRDENNRPPHGKIEFFYFTNFSYIHWNMSTAPTCLQNISIYFGSIKCSW